MSDLDALIARVIGEYREMPGLKLTRMQGSRLWQVDAATCDGVFRRLVEAGFLREVSDGAFVASSAIATSHAGSTRGAARGA